MQLNSQEASLLDAFRRLPAGTAGELLALIQRLADLSSGTRIDSSDSWSEEDLREFTAHSLERFEAEGHRSRGLPGTEWSGLTTAGFRTTSASCLLLVQVTSVNGVCRDLLDKTITQLGHRVIGNLATARITVID